MIFEFIRENSSFFKIELMVRTLNVSRSGYYKYINKVVSKQKQETIKLTETIFSIYKDSRGTYGSPRIHAILKQNGERISRQRVARIMKLNNIRAKMIKKYRPKKKSIARLKMIKPNILDQNFKTEDKNKAWVTDITYIKTDEGWLYLSAVLDLFSRKIVGLGMGHLIDVDLVIRSLKQAINHRNPDYGLILHSDRGSQYTSNEYQIFAKKHGITLSMSALGYCYDNAVIESFFHTLKTEHTSLLRFRTRSEAISSIFEYVEVFYNRKRIHSTLNYLSPTKFEELGYFIADKDSAKNLVVRV